MEAAEPEGVVLVGNPNVGKSALFGALTGKYVTVSNYPGTTVEVSRGQTVIGGRRVAVIATPGPGTLAPTSEDQRVTRATLLADTPRPGSLLPEPGDPECTSPPHLIGA